MTEFSYRYSSGGTGFIICSFLLAGSSASASGPSPEARKSEIAELISIFAQNGMEALDLSEDEFAKAHVRHLVGGRAEVKEERVFRFGMPPYFHCKERQKRGVPLILAGRRTGVNRTVGTGSRWTE